MPAARAVEEVDARLGEAAPEFFRQRHGLEGDAADGDEDEMGLRDQLLFALAAHLEVEAQGLRADATDEDADFQQVVQTRGPAEVAFEVCAREPDVQLVEHRAGFGVEDGVQRAGWQFGQRDRHQRQIEREVTAEIAEDVAGNEGAGGAAQRAAAAANASAVARPIPLEAPITTTTCSATVSGVIAGAAASATVIAGP